MTPTAPVYEDRRRETPLNATPEESLEGLSAAIRGIEDSRVTQQPSVEAKGPVSIVAPLEVSELILRWLMKELVKKNYLEEKK